jgi:hypothetical protein
MMARRDILTRAELARRDFDDFDDFDDLGDADGVPHKDGVRQHAERAGLVHDRREDGR